MAARKRLARPVLDLLATHPAGWVATLALRNKTVPIRALRENAAEGESRRLGVASNPRCPADLLASLGDDPAKAVLEAVAHHRSTPDGTLFCLAKSGHQEVRQAVAHNPSASEGVRVVAALSGP